MTQVREIVSLLLETDEDEQEDIDILKDVATDPDPQRDFYVEANGSVWLIDPQNEVAARWLHGIISDDSTWIGSALAVEQRFVGNIIYVIQSTGFTSNVKLVPRKAGEIGEAENEDDDQETLKDILGLDFFKEEPPAAPKMGSIERFDRWADIEIDGLHFCISYLTPVAVYVPGEAIKLTDRRWSSTTCRHIAKWAAHIGLTKAGGGAYTYNELKQRHPQIPQEEITKLFKEEASQVRWSKREMKQAVTFREPASYKYVKPENRIGLKPYVSPREEFE